MIWSKLTRQSTLGLAAALALGALGAACGDDGAQPPPDGGATGDAAQTADTGQPPADGAAPADQGTGPGLDTTPWPTKPCGFVIGDNLKGTVGDNKDFSIGGATRTFIVQKVNVPAGYGKKLPIIFGYHGTGSYYNIPTQYFKPVSESRPFVYVAPKGSGTYTNPYDFSTDPSQNKDIKLFDDLIKCLAAELPVDLSRVHAFGFSWGGHWINHLLGYRGQVIASAAQLSSGAIGPSGATYEAMLSKLGHKPAQLVIWGGVTDQYNGYSFDLTCKNTVTSFRKVGLFVVQCIHGDGHDITPPESLNKFIFEFFQDHPRGVTPEPYLSWPPAAPFTQGTYLAWPSYCTPAP